MLPHMSSHVATAKLDELRAERIGAGAPVQRGLGVRTEDKSAPVPIGDHGQSRGRDLNGVAIEQHKTRTRLEVDHIDPFEKGGGRGEENLRMFCRAHNLLAADREFGEDFMRGRIECAKIEGRKERQLSSGVKDTG